MFSLIVISSLNVYLGNSFYLKSSSCGDWTALGNDKCIKIIDKFESYEQAKKNLFGL